MSTMTITHRRRHKLGAAIAITALSMLALPGLASASSVDATTQRVSTAPGASSHLVTESTNSPATITVTNTDGSPVGTISGPLTVQLEATGFQSIAGGLGGIYVMIGTIHTDDWEPSQGGASGVSYQYVADVQQLENAGYQKYVAFPGSATSEEANGGTVDADGNWRTELTIPGPIMEVMTSDFTPETIDCTRVTCGIITVGGHGVVSPTNETFTPLEFAPEGSVVEPAPSQEPNQEPSEEPSEEPAAEPTQDATAQPEASPTPGSDTGLDGMSTSTRVWIFVAALAGLGALAAVIIRQIRRPEEPGWTSPKK